MAPEIIKDLRLNDSPEVKIIKHACWNNPEVKEKIKDIALKWKESWEYTINLKI